MNKAVLLLYLAASATEVVFADRVTDIAALYYNPIRSKTIYVQHTGNETSGEVGMYMFNYALKSEKVVMIDLLGGFALEVKETGYALKKADGSPVASHDFTAAQLKEAEKMVKDNQTEPSVEVEALYYTPMDALHAIEAIEIQMGPRGVGGDRGFFKILSASEFTDHTPPATIMNLAGGYVLEVFFGNNFNGNYTVRRADNGILVTSGGDLDLISMQALYEDSGLLDAYLETPLPTPKPAHAGRRRMTGKNASNNIIKQRRIENIAAVGVDASAIIDQ